jgi:hypothetical protein
METDKPEFLKQRVLRTTNMLHLPETVQEYLGPDFSAESVYVYWGQAEPEGLVLLGAGEEESPPDPFSKSSTIDSTSPRVRLPKAFATVLGVSQGDDIYLVPNTGDTPEPSVLVCSLDRLVQTIDPSDSPVPTSNATSD